MWTVGLRAKLHKNEGITTIFDAFLAHFQWRRVIPPLRGWAWRSRKAWWRGGRQHPSVSKITSTFNPRFYPQKRSPKTHKNSAIGSSKMLFWAKSGVRQLLTTHKKGLFLHRRPPFVHSISQIFAQFSLPDERQIFKRRWLLKIWWRLFSASERLFRKNYSQPPKYQPYTKPFKNGHFFSQRLIFLKRCQSRRGKCSILLYTSLIRTVQYFPTQNEPHAPTLEGSSIA